MPPMNNAAKGSHQTTAGPLFWVTVSGRLAHLSFSARHHSNACGLMAQNNANAGPPQSPLPTILQDHLDSYLAGKSRRIEIPVSPFFLDRGTLFQQQVWQLLLSIPYGETRTYGQMAAALGNPGCCRAIGQACNANPLALIRPCHRVVAANASGGFAGGPEIKKILLALEKETVGSLSRCGIARGCGPL